MAAYRNATMPATFAWIGSCLKNSAATGSTEDSILREVLYTDPEQRGSRFITASLGNSSIFLGLMSDLADYFEPEDASFNVFITDKNSEALTGETALMMPFFYLFDEVETSIDDQPTPDHAFVRCVEKILELGDVRGIQPALNTITTRYDGESMTVVDMLLRLLDKTKKYSTTIIQVSGLQVKVEELLSRFQDQGGLPAKTVEEYTKMKRKYIRAETKLAGKITDIKKMWQKLILSILDENTDQALALIDQIKKTDTVDNFQRGLMLESLTLDGEDEGISACYAAVMKTNKIIFEKLVEGLSDADKNNLCLLTSPNNPDKTLGALALSLSKNADRDSFQLYLHLKNKQENKMVSGGESKGEDPMVVREKKEKRDATEIARMLGVRTRTRTPTSGFPRVYTDDKVSETYENRWLPLMEQDKIISGQTVLDGITKSVMTEEQFKTLKMQCLFGLGSLKQTPYQLTGVQMDIFKRGLKNNITYVDPNFRLRNGTLYPAVTDSQKQAGLEFDTNTKKYSFTKAHERWVWARVAPFEEGKNKCKCYRLDSEGGVRQLMREIFTYDEVDIERGELVLCNTYEEGDSGTHEKFLEKANDEGRVTFMDKTLSLRRAENSMMWGGIGGGSVLSATASLAGLSGLGLAPFVGAAALWYYLKEQNKGPNEYLYCKVVRVLDRPVGEAILDPDRKYLKPTMATASVAAGGATLCVFNLYGANGQIVEIAKRTVEGWIMTPLEAQLSELSVENYSEEALSLLEQAWYYTNALLGEYADVGVSVVIGSLFAFGVYKAWEAKIIGLDGKTIDSSHTVREGYVQTQNLQHNYTGDLDETKWPLRKITDVEIKWMIHESVLRQMFSGFEPPRKAGMYYLPNGNPDVARFLTPKMVDGRAFRTNFLVRF